LVINGDTSLINLSDTLVILQLGGHNDMFNGENKTVVIAENARRAIANLAQQGAHKILALNLIDLSEAPGVQNADGGGEIGKWVSLLTSEANMASFARLKVQSNPDKCTKYVSIVRAHATTQRGYAVLRIKFSYCVCSNN
jgi:hypothetical protein